MVRRFFITGTGTGIGKTYLTAALTRALKAEGETVLALKPVLSGLNEEGEHDAEILLKSQGLPVTEESLEAIAPWRFAAPLSPDMAAAREGRAIDMAELIAFSLTAAEEGICLIEGVGGVMVPLSEKHTVLDWMAALSCPVILVAGSYLGSLSHTLTAYAALRRRGVNVAAIVVNESQEGAVPLEETVATLARFVGAPLYTFPRGGSKEALAAMMEVITA